MNKSEQCQLEKKYEEMLNRKAAELEKDYETRLRKALSVVAAKFDSLKVVCAIINNAEIDQKPTNLVFKVYESICMESGIQPMSDIEFSKFIAKEFNYLIADKKIKGKKRRIFIKIYNGIDEKP